MDLSRIIDDLLSGRAKLYTSDAITAAAAAGAAIDRWLFACPQGVMRLILHINLTATKTTGTLVTIRMYQAGVAVSREIYLFNRTISNTADVIGLPSDDGSDKDEAEAAANTPLFMFYGDSLRLEHGSTAGETISDVMTVTYIEWRLERLTVLPKKKPEGEPVILESPQAMSNAGVAMWR